MKNNLYHMTGHACQMQWTNNCHALVSSMRLTSSGRIRRNFYRLLLASIFLPSTLLLLGKDRPSLEQFPVSRSGKRFREFSSDVFCFDVFKSIFAGGKLIVTVMSRDGRLYCRQSLIIVLLLKIVRYEYLSTINRVF